MDVKKSADKSGIDYAGELEAAQTLADVESLLTRLFDLQEEDPEAAIDKVFARITDPALRKLIDAGLKAELAAIVDEYARKARTEVTRCLEKSEVAVPDVEKLSDTRLYVYGRNIPEEAAYEVLEADEIQASHLPESGFDRNPAYGLENERLYHKELASQEKVLTNAANLNPDFLLRDSVDANNGAPVLDHENNVLGGNSRVMSLKKAWEAGGKRAENYRKELLARARQLGLDVRRIEKMKKPVLVRKLKKAYSKEERQSLVASLNDNFTDSKDARAQGKSRGDRLSPKTLQALGNALQDANTLRDFFDEPRSRNIVDLLLEDGVIKQSDRNAMLGVDGLLNPYGKNLLEDALRGRICDSYDTLAKVPASIIAKVDVIIPFILIAEIIGNEWNITKYVNEALKVVVEYLSSNFYGHKDFYGFLHSIDAISGKTPAERFSKTASQFASMLLDSKKRSLMERFRKFSGDAITMSKESNAMFTISAKDSARQNLDLVLESSGLQSIFEKATSADSDYRAMIREALTLRDLENVLGTLFGLKLPSDPGGYKNQSSDYGLKVRGVKAREKLNVQCMEILERVKQSDDLTAEDRSILLQYSGRGGLTENSQWEYFTPTPVAQGIWEAMKANGFENGNVLEPSCGAGVFLGTKPAGVVMSANDLDPISSGVAAQLNPGDFVSNSPFESIVLETPDDTFDSCVGNVPFGNARGKSMSIDPAYKNEKQVERYFILRILDRIRPGGLACLVVPISVIGDKGARWKEFRIAVSKKAEFLGAHKLPSSTFGGKGGQGTDTVTDVIVLRKHGRELLDKLARDEISLETLRTANVLWDEFISGKYWQGEGRPFIMGRYIPKDAKVRFSREKVEGNIDDAALKRNLARKFHSRINWEILEAAEPILRNYVDNDRRDMNGVPYEYRNGEWLKMENQPASVVLDKETFGAESVAELEALLKDPEGALELTVTQAQALQEAYPWLVGSQQRNALALASAQASEKTRNLAYRGAILGAMIAKMGADEEAGEDVSARREKLQNLVVAEISRYGHPANNFTVPLMGENSRAFGIFLNFVDKEGKFSDLLAGTLDKSKAKGYQDDSIEDIVNWLYNANNGQVEFEDIKRLYKGNIPLETLGDLAGLEGIAITPDGLILSASTYFSGDLPQKISELQTTLGQIEDKRLKGKFQKQIEILDSRIKRVPLEDITFGLQQKWFGKRYILEFLRENGYPYAAYGKWVEEEYETYDGSLSTRVIFREDADFADGEFLLYGAQGKKPEKFVLQFQKYLNGNNISGGTKDAISDYKEAARQMEEAFDAWMKQHPDCDELAEQYSFTFNGYAPVEYDGGPLDIEELISGEIIPHSYQNAEVRRLSEQGSGICGFGTGLGKSFTALAMAAYSYKHGRAKRTCIVVPSAVLENWYHEARMFYSEKYMRASVLVVGLEPKVDQDGNVERRPILDENGEIKTGKNGHPIMQDVLRFANGKREIYETMWKIPQSNYTLVVMSKEKFQSIPVKPDTMRTYTESMVKRHLLSERDAGKFTDGKKKSYAEDKKINRLEGIHSNEGGTKKEELPYLEDMGFDSIISDESHFFKNSLSRGEKMGGIAGISSPDPSDIAIDMAIKCDWLRRRNNGRGVYGLTATPVTNSPIEIFNMLSLVCPIEEFDKMGIHTVDDFIRVFGKVEERERLSTALVAEMKDTLVGFQNLQGLRNLFNKYVNIKTVADVDDEIHVPNAENIEEEVELTDNQNILYLKLKAEAAQSSKAGFKRDDNTRSIFSIMRDMDRLSTDEDLFKRQMTFVFSSTREKEIRKLAGTLPTSFTVEEKDEETGVKHKTEYEFEPQVTVTGGTVSLVVHEQHEKAVLRSLAQAVIPETEITHPVAPKYARLIANLKIHLESGGKQIIFIEEKTQHQKLKRILTHNLPIDEKLLAIINAEDAKRDLLDKISKAYNAGEIKIVIANKKAEVGVNLQKGTTAIHHLTLPWTPASINQRNGRGVRQGNKVDTVKIYYYHGKDTFDAYRKQILDSKANWIGQLLTGKEATAENADIAADEEMAAMLAGNIENYRKEKAEREAKRKQSTAIQLVNRLKILQSLTASLNTLEERRLAAKNLLDAEIEEQRNRTSRYAREGKGEATVRKAQERLVALEGKRDSIDLKFDAERTKSESQRNQIRAMLGQAAKKGGLPFDPGLLDHPENCLVTLKGHVLAVGDCLECHDTVRTISFRKELDGIYRVAKLDAGKKTVELEGVNTPDYHYSVLAESLAEKGAPTALSPAEITWKRFLSGQLAYFELPRSGVTKEQFLENLDNLKFKELGAVAANSQGELFLLEGWEQRWLEDKKYVWPEPDNDAFRKNVLTQWLVRRKQFQFEPASPYDPYRTLLEGLFGKDYPAQAQAWANNASQEEMNSIIGNVWERIRKAFEQGSFYAKVNAGYGRNELSGKMEVAAKSAFSDCGYDNSSDFEQALYLFIKNKWEEVKKLANEFFESARQEVMEEESQQKSPALPSAILSRFEDNGIKALYNHRDVFQGSMTNRKSYPAFTRLFLQDEKGIGGKLYRMKESLKSRFDAKFTKCWLERSGAWWHLRIESENDFEELCGLLNI